jgi:outer membrane protein assembly factor BamC
VRNNVLTLAATLLLVVSVTGCQTIDEKRKIDYRNAPTLPPLDVPPGLSTPDQRLPGADAGTATYSNYAGDQKPTTSGRNTVLPTFTDIRLAREGQTRYLVVKAEPEQLWDPLREFVISTGLLIAEENPNTGVIETEWAENRALLASQQVKVIAKWLASMYSTGTRDKYRLRLERGAVAGTTEIYLSHRGLEQEERSDSALASSTGQWRSRASDPELEAEMLQRLAMQLAGEPAAKQVRAETAAPTPASSNARLTNGGNGAPLLALQDRLDRAWRRVGLSLDRIGFTVEDRDRSKGIYYVRYNDPEKQGDQRGFLSRWFGSEPPVRNQYQVQLKSGESGTNVEVLDKDGVPEASKTGERILSLLYEQLK